MKIVVDAMGGDHAPEAVVEGAVMATKEYGAEIILTGLSDRINEELRKHGNLNNPLLQVCHAEEVVKMCDIPAKVLRSKKKSSIKIGLDLIKNGSAKAFVSAGNTGAVLAYATIILRPLKGVDRSAIAIQLPTLQGTSILIDAGANVDCKSLQLFQFAVMGHVYAKFILGKESPTVGLLSIGEEDGKGNETTKEVFQMLKKSHLNFMGNVEGKEVFRGNVDVIVCDGFTGNVALKISESLVEMIGAGLKTMFQSSVKSRLAYSLLKTDFEKFRKSVDYSETGGAPLLGVNGVCIIAHGSSSAKAVKNAVKRATELLEKKVNEHIQEDIEINLADQDLWFRKGMIWKHLRESIPFGAPSNQENHQPPQDQEKTPETKISNEEKSP